MSTGEIEKLLEDGLELYGLGKTEEAIAVWRKVLEIEPNNQKAVDYIESAGFSRQSEIAVDMHPKDAEFININYIRDLLKARRFELAYEFLEHLAQKGTTFNKQLVAYLFMVKAQLIRGYYEELDGFKKVPKLNISSHDIVKYNLGKADGYIVSRVDGYSTAEEVIQMCSGIDRFDAMKRLSKLARLGVIGF